MGRALLLAVSTARISSFAPAVSRRHLVVSSGHRETFRPASAITSTDGDTPTKLPEFDSNDEYLEYLATVSALPKGFATGSADGTFVSVEAPAMGPLGIKGTIISLTNGPTDNWAAVFTSNKVRILRIVQ